MLFALAIHGDIHKIDSCSHWQDDWSLYILYLLTASPVFRKFLITYASANMHPCFCMHACTHKRHTKHKSTHVCIQIHLIPFLLSDKSSVIFVFYHLLRVRNVVKILKWWIRIMFFQSLKKSSNCAMNHKRSCAVLPSMLCWMCAQYHNVSFCQQSYFCHVVLTELCTIFFISCRVVKLYHQAFVDHAVPSLHKHLLIWIVLFWSGSQCHTMNFCATPYLFIQMANF